MRTNESANQDGPSLCRNLGARERFPEMRTRGRPARCRTVGSDNLRFSWRPFRGKLGLGRWSCDPRRQGHPRDLPFASPAGTPPWAPTPLPPARPTAPRLFEEPPMSSALPPKTPPPRAGLYRLYRQFFDLAERKRRWSLADDIPWDQV